MVRFFVGKSKKKEIFFGILLAYSYLCTQIDVKLKAYKYEKNFFDSDVFGGGCADSVKIKE